MSADSVECKQMYFDGAKLGRAHHHFLWIAAVAYFFDQMDMQLFSYVAPKLQIHWQLTMEQVAGINSAAFWGMFVGGIFGGWLAGRIGRKPSLLFAITIFSISSIVNATVDNLTIFTLARFFTGFGTISMAVISMVYMSEMLPSESRGKYQALTMVCGTIGNPFGAMFAKWAIPIGAETWRWVFLIGSAGIILVPIGFAWLKESPRWLVSKGRYREAEKIVFDCIGRNLDLSQESAHCSNGEISILATLKIMISSSYAKRTFVVALLTIGATVGTFFLGAWYPVLMTKMGMEMGIVLTIVGLSAFGSPLGDVAASFISDRGGRKNPIIICSILIAIVFVLTGLAGTNQTMLMIIFILRTGLAACIMNMIWVYIAESFPTKIRSNATGIIFSAGRLLTAAVNYIVPPLYAAVGFFGINVVNGLIFLVPAIIAIFFGQKTAMKTLEELEAEAENKA